VGLVVAVTLIGSLAYLVYSLRSSFRTLRGVVTDLIGEGTLATRLLPNLAFGTLFILLLSQSMQAKTTLPILQLPGLGAIHDLYEVQTNNEVSSLGIATIMRNTHPTKQKPPAQVPAQSRDHITTPGKF